MEEKIRLMSAGFHSQMEETQLRLTKARDELSCLEAEQRRLSGIWEGAAKEQWETEFLRELLAIGEGMEAMTKLLQKTQEPAKKLFQTENALIGEAERL